jgi:hypothetical protein
MSLTKKNIFLLDGIGAVLSLVLTGLILPLFSDFLGLPKQLLYSLALFPLIFSIFSLGCYHYVKVIKSWMLLAIIVANLIYCLISGFLIFYFERITIWGQILLVVEMIVILIVVAVELSVYKSLQDQKQN